MANPEDQAVGGVEAWSGVEFFGRHGLAEQKISATLPTRTVGCVFTVESLVQQLYCIVAAVYEYLPGIFTQMFPGGGVFSF